jgi:hypothetical protein
MNPSMPKLLRPRHEFPTPLFLAFCAAVAIAVAAWLVWRVRG